ncbi:MAG: phage terminase large subunit [Clostridia bacterium]|nr:phage terminase large subunit [Clostridia bacterium]
MKKSKNLVLSGYPQKRQKEFFLADAKYVAYGGARGGGKSWALRRKLVLLALNYEGISMLLIRRTLPELRENHIRPLVCELSDFCNYSETKKCFEFPSGSRLQLGYLDSDSDLLQYQGQEYDIIALDEATQLTEYQFQTLKACLRGANNFPKRMYITCNPGGVGHGWVKRLFIDRDFREGENPDDYKFIQALVYDNEILLSQNPDYLDQLKSLPPSLKSAWLNGRWDEFEGQFFSEFDYHKHTIDVGQIAPGAKKYCAIDYGLDMLAALFVAVDGKGDCVVYDEIHRENLIVSHAAELIKEKMDGVCMVIAPSDLWSRQKDSGKSIAELFSENGVYLTKLKSERIGGWMCLREFFKKEGKLKIMRNCQNLIRCIPLLLHDKHRIGDASTVPHNITHAPDALRYFAVSRYGDIFPNQKIASSKKLKDIIKKEKRI